MQATKETNAWNKKQPVTARKSPQQWFQDRTSVGNLSNWNTTNRCTSMRGDVSLHPDRTKPPPLSSVFHRPVTSPHSRVWKQLLSTLPFHSSTSTASFSLRPRVSLRRVPRDEEEASWRGGRGDGLQLQGGGCCKRGVSLGNLSIKYTFTVWILHWLYYSWILFTTVIHLDAYVSSQTMISTLSKCKYLCEHWFCWLLMLDTDWLLHFKVKYVLDKGSKLFGPWPQSFPDRCPQTQCTVWLENLSTRMLRLNQFSSLCCLHQNEQNDCTGHASKYLRCSWAKYTRKLPRSSFTLCPFLLSAIHS